MSTDTLTSSSSSSSSSNSSQNMLTLNLDPQPISPDLAKVQDLVILRDGFSLTGGCFGTSLPNPPHDPNHKTEVIKAVSGLALQNPEFMTAAKQTLGLQPFAQKVSFVLTVEDNDIYVKKPSDPLWKKVGAFRGSDQFRQDVYQKTYQIYDDCVRQNSRANNHNNNNNGGCNHCQGHDHASHTNSLDDSHQPIIINNNIPSCNCCHNNQGSGSYSLEGKSLTNLTPAINNAEVDALRKEIQQLREQLAHGNLNAASPQLAGINERLSRLENNQLDSTLKQQLSELTQLLRDQLNVIHHQIDTNEKNSAAFLAQIAKLNETIQKLVQENGALKNQREADVRTIDSQKEKINNLQGELNAIKEQQRLLQEQLNSSEDRNHELDTQNKLLTLQYQWLLLLMAGLQNSLMDANKTNAELKQALQVAEKQLKELQEQIAQLSGKNDLLTKAVALLLVKILQLSPQVPSTNGKPDAQLLQQINELQQQVQGLRDEIRKLTENLNEATQALAVSAAKNRELEQNKALYIKVIRGLLEQLKNKDQEAQKNSDEIAAHKEKVQQLEGKNGILSKENQELQKQIQQNALQLQELGLKADANKETIERLTLQNGSLNEKIEKNARDIEQLRKEAAENGVKVQFLEAEKQRILAEIADLKSKLDGKEEELKSLREQLSQQSIELATQKEKVLSLTGENANLKKDKESLSDQLGKAKDALSKATNELSASQATNAQLAKQLEAAQKLNQLLQGKVDELNIKLIAKISENERNSTDLADFRRQTQELQNEKVALSERNRVLQEQIGQKDRLIVEQKVKLEQSKETIERLAAEKKDLLAQIKDNTARIEQLTQQAAEMATRIQVLDAEARSNQNEIRELKAQIQELKAQIVSKDQEIAKLKEQILNLTRENATLLERVNGLTRDVERLEKDNASLLKEKESLTTQLGQTKDALSKANADLSGSQARNEELAKQLLVAQQSNGQLQAKNSQLEDENRALLERIRVNEVAIASSKVDSESLERLTAENSSLTEQIAANKAEMQRLADQVRSQAAEIEKLKADKRLSDNTINQLQKRVQNLQNLVGRKEQAIKDLRQRLADKEVEITGLSGQINGLNEQVSKLGKENASLKKEKAQLSQKVEQAQQNLDETAQKLTESAEKNSALEQQLAAAKKTNEHLQTTIQGLLKKLKVKSHENLNHNSKVNKNRKAIRNLSVRNKALESKISDLEKIVQKNNQLIEQLKKAGDENKEQIRLLSEENQALKTEIAGKHDEIAKSTGQIQDKSAEAGKLAQEEEKQNAEVAALKETINQLQAQVSANSDVIQQLTEQVNQGKEKIQALELANGQLKEENEKLKEQIAKRDPAIAKLEADGNDLNATDMEKSEEVISTLINKDKVSDDELNNQMAMATGILQRYIAITKRSIELLNPLLENNEEISHRRYSRLEQNPYVRSYSYVPITAQQLDWAFYNKPALKKQAEKLQNYQGYEQLRSEADQVYKEHTTTQRKCQELMNRIFVNGIVTPVTFVKPVNKNQGLYKEQINPALPSNSFINGSATYQPAPPIQAAQVLYQTAPVNYHYLNRPSGATNQQNATYFESRK